MSTTELHPLLLNMTAKIVKSDTGFALPAHIAERYRGIFELQTATTKQHLATGLIALVLHYGDLDAQRSKHLIDQLCVMIDGLLRDSAAEMAACRV